MNREQTRYIIEVLEREISGYSKNYVPERINFLKEYVNELKNKQVLSFEEQLEEKRKCSQDIVYFVKKYIKIVNYDCFGEFKTFDPYPIQEKMLEHWKEHNYSICKIPRQSGLNMTIGAYILHRLLFYEKSSISIVSDKHETARCYLKTVRQYYERLPRWMQYGVIYNNKIALKLTNGNRVSAYSVSSAGLRGTGTDCLILPDYAFVSDKQAETFTRSIMPTITYKKANVIISSVPNGNNHFYKLWKDAVEGKNQYVPFSFNWSDIPGREGEWKKLMIENIGLENFAKEFETEFLEMSP